MFSFLLLGAKIQATSLPRLRFREQGTNEVASERPPGAREHDVILL